MDAVSTHTGRTRYALHDVERLVLSQLPNEPAKRYDTLKIWVVGKLHPYKTRGSITGEEFMHVVEELQLRQPPAAKSNERDTMQANHELMRSAFERADLTTLTPLHAKGRITSARGAVEGIDRDGIEVFGDAGAPMRETRAPRRSKGGDWRAPLEEATLDADMATFAAALARRRVDRQRLAEEAEAKRLADEAEAQRLAQEAEARRVAEVERLTQEAEAERLAIAQRAEEEAEAARRDEALRARLAAERALTRQKLVEQRNARLQQKQQREADRAHAKADRAAAKQERQAKPPAARAASPAPKPRKARITLATAAAVAVRTPLKEKHPLPSDHLFYSHVRKEMGIAGGNTRFADLWDELEALAPADPKPGDTISIELDERVIHLGFFDTATKHGRAWALARADLPTFKEIYKARVAAARPVSHASQHMVEPAPPLPEDGSFISKTTLCQKMQCHAQKDPEFEPLWKSLESQAEDQRPLPKDGRVTVKFEGHKIEMGHFRKARRTSWYISASALPVLHQYIRECRKARAERIERPEDHGFSMMNEVRVAVRSDYYKGDGFEEMRDELVRLAKEQPGHEEGPVTVRFAERDITLRCYKSPHHTFWAIANDSVPLLKTYMEERRATHGYSHTQFDELQRRKASAGRG